MMNNSDCIGSIQQSMIESSLLRENEPMNPKSLTQSTLMALSLLFVLPACGQQSSTQPSSIKSGRSDTSQQSVSLKIGETANLEATGFKLTFVAIKEDSRCPLNTSCIQEGQVTAVLNLSRPSESTIRTIYLTLRALQPGLSVQHVEGYDIKLKRVTPYPEAGTAKADRDYIVNLSIGTSH